MAISNEAPVFIRNAQQERLHHVDQRIQGVITDGGHMERLKLARTDVAQQLSAEELAEYTANLTPSMRRSLTAAGVVGPAVVDQQG